MKGWVFEHKRRCGAKLGPAWMTEDEKLPDVP